LDFFKVFFPPFSNFDFLISISEEGIENKHIHLQFAKQSTNEYARQMLVYKFLNSLYQCDEAKGHDAMSPVII
jgi:hypothetical protein